MAAVSENLLFAAFLLYLAAVPFFGGAIKGKRKLMDRAEIRRHLSVLRSPSSVF